LCATKNCECHVIYDPKTKTLRTTGEERIYHYYHCTDGKRVHKNSKKKQKNVSHDFLMTLLSKTVSEISITNELAIAISKALKAAHEQTLAAHKRNIDRYKTVIQQTEQEEDKAY